MRMIGTVSNEEQASRLGHYLASVGIANKCEVTFDAVSGHMSYHLWVHDEDNLAAAAALFEEFQQKPSSPKFNVEIMQEPEPIPDNPLPPPTSPHRFKPRLTYFFLSLCVFIFFMNTLQEMPLRQEGLAGSAFLMTPLQALFMFDLPPAEDAPYWRGIYDWVVLKIKGQDTASSEGPLFFRIRQGQVWRLFTPCILHGNFLHILFNMLWLWYLGRPIEERIGSFRTLVLTLAAGIGSNVIQYLMSGPFFIGYSGIVMGLAGFIWMRERLAPWEGYPLNQSTILFLFFFVTAIFALQVIAFFIQIFTSSNFAPQIANTAHLVGAMIGALLAYSPFFAQRVVK